MKMLFAVLVMFTAVAAQAAPATQPTTRSATPPAKRPTAAESDATLNSLLMPRPQDQPLQPVADVREPGIDWVVPRTPTPLTPLKREGTYIYDRVGRLEKTADGQQEFRFEADGAAMQDPPMLVLQNQNLMLMEKNLKAQTTHPKFRITAMITEYGARNYLLIQKWIVVGENSLLQDKKK
jgi:hypothetical protein